MPVVHPVQEKLKRIAAELGAQALQKSTVNLNSEENEKYAGRAISASGVLRLSIENFCCLAFIPKAENLCDGFTSLGARGSKPATADVVASFLSPAFRRKFRRFLVLSYNRNSDSTRPKRNQLVRQDRRPLHSAIWGISSSRNAVRKSTTTLASGFCGTSCPRTMS